MTYRDAGSSSSRCQALRRVWRSGLHHGFLRPVKWGESKPNTRTRQRDWPPVSCHLIAVSLQIVFAAIVGGMYSMLGPTVGSLLTLSLNEGLRVGFGINFIGAANTIYGILLILCIIFMPRGIVGALRTSLPRSCPRVVPAE